MSLALDSSKALRPSKSRRLTSLPSIAPWMTPLLDTASTTSGSGLFQLDLGWMPMSAPWPTADSGWALVNTSASGPIPTSRYCDHRPCSTSTLRSASAWAEPGTICDRSAPMRLARVSRIASALAGSPLACSSTTRSSRLVAKVTPAAFTACRSMGASSHGWCGSRRAGSLLPSKAGSPISGSASGRLRR
ncbi:hypothetical protein D3C75_838270 [compost metagenome]